MVQWKKTVLKVAVEWIVLQMLPVDTLALRSAAHLYSLVQLFILLQSFHCPLPTLLHYELFWDIALVHFGYTIGSDQ